MAAELAKVQPGAQPLKADNINDVWLGTVYLADGSVVRAFLKDIYPKEMANELVGAAFARALGLPVPRSFLAVAKPDVLPATKAPALGNCRVLFGSERKDVPPLGNFWVGDRIEQSYLDALAMWPKCGSVFAFDTWIANIDRNVNNLLFKGSGDVWLIDHGHCLTGPTWTAVELEAEGDYRNAMATWLTRHLTSKQKAAFRKAILELPKAIRKMDLDAIAKASKAASILTEADARAMLAFLKARVDHLPRIAMKQAGIPELLI